MKDISRGQKELEIAQKLLAYATQQFCDEHPEADVDVGLIAGAFLRVSVVMVTEQLGIEGGSKAVRQALENVLRESERFQRQQQRTLQ